MSRFRAYEEETEMKSRNLVDSVHRRSPDQGEPIDKAFLPHLQEASHSQALVLLRGFNHPDMLGKQHSEL